MDLIYSAAQFIIDAIAAITTAILSLLPDSPFTWEIPSWLQAVGYFIPFNAMLALMMYYVAAVAIWYGIRQILRIVRAIQ